VTRFPECKHDAAAARALSETGPSRTSRRTAVVRPFQFLSAEVVAEAIAGYWRDQGGREPSRPWRRHQPGSALARWSNHLLVRTEAFPQTNWLLACIQRSMLGISRGLARPAVRVRSGDAGSTGARSFNGESAGNRGRTGCGIPLLALPAEAVVDPKVVSDYVWPRNASRGRES